MLKPLSFLVGGLLLLLPGCQHVATGGAEPPAAPPSWALDPDLVVLHIPSEASESLLHPTAMRVRVRETRGEMTAFRTEGLRWESSDAAIATVEADGEVRAVMPGRAVITATAAEDAALAGTASVIVKEGGQAHVILE